MKKHILFAILLSASLNCLALEKEYIWPEGRMPDTQSGQIAAMTDVSLSEGFKPDEYRIPYLEWFGKPENANGACMILISGGGYFSCCDVQHIKTWRAAFEKEGIQCVNFVYRTPRPKGLPIYQTAWEDGQRAVRIVRSEAEKRGFDPEKIGTISMSAGSHLALLLATSSQTPAYEKIDELDELPCHINWAIVNAPAYITTDSDAGTPASREGYGPDVKLTESLKFDSKTCPMSLHHGGKDPYTPNGSTLVYRELRKRGIPAELHLYADKGHAPLGLERGMEFLHQMGFLGKPEPEVELMSRYPSDEARAQKIKEDVWPEGKMPDVQENQCKPYIEWHFPEVLKTKAIQIIYSGGAYVGNSPDDFEVAPIRRYLNSLGMTVVTLKYRTPRPSAESGLSKHTTAWQDLQRTVRVVRSKAESLGLDPDRIGIMGSSAGGHLTLMGVSSSRHNSYNAIDELDKISCKVQWGIGVYPAYALSDGADGYNRNGGNYDSDILVPEFSFDIDTAPMLLLHGDADPYASMASVKVWEKMRSMGIQSELHILALRQHCFQRYASPKTGSYGFLERIGEYLRTICEFQETPIQKEPVFRAGEPFRDGMVLAEGKKVNVYGEGRGRIIVKVAGKKAVCIAEDGKWEAVLPKMKAGGPYRMTISSEDGELVFNDVYVGRVIVIAGQSNIQFKLRESSTPEAEWTRDNLLREYTLPRIEKGEPFTPKDGWVPCTDDNVGGWSAIGYHIGKIIRGKTGKAVALVNCYQGASIIETWIPEDIVNQEKYSLSEDLIGKDRKVYNAWNAPGQLFHYSLEALTPYTVNEVVWYQGESNTGKGEYAIYPQLAVEMVNAWRAAFKDPSLPFVFIQIADFDYRKDDGWKNLQKAQMTIPSLVEGVVTVPCADVCESDNIHPKTKSVLSERVADILLKGVKKSR